MRRAYLIAGFIVVSLALCAQAELITIAVEATIGTVDDPAGHLEGKITPGGFITGYYSYESTTADSNPSENIGEWWYDSPCGVFLDAGGFQFYSNPISTEFYFAVSNDLQDGDSYILRSKYHLPLSNGVSVEEIIWQVDDSSGTALGSDSLPLTAPVLTDWDDNRLYIKGGPRGLEFSIDAVVTSAAVIPEPTTVLLLTLGVLGIRRRFI